MGNKDELKKLYAQKYTVTIEGATFELQQLSLDDPAVLNMDMDAPVSEKFDQNLLLIAKSLDVDKEDVKKIAVEYLEPLLNEILKANGLDLEDDDAVNARLEKIRKFQKK